MGHRPAIGLLDIGQSDEEIDPDFAQLSGNIDFVTVAPLNAYTIEEMLEKFRPVGRKLALSSVTKTGERVLISSSALVLELHKGVQEAQSLGLAALLVTCTNTFDLGKTSVPVISPGELLNGRVQLHQNQLHKVAILVPVREQEGPLTERWTQRLPRMATIKSFTLPPQSTLPACEQLGGCLAKLGFDTVIMDCFGYSLAQYKAIQGCVKLAFNAKAVSMAFLKERVDNLKF
jgi:hypothetical protein